ncbi:hypothetical protein HGF60_10090 [Alteromonadaceae bacterium A_SAG2]|nr:hypothetical protein [Alteromonadaceae bacterium A_SAG2]
MITSNPEILQPVAQSLNQASTQKQGCSQTSGSKQQRQGFAEIMDTLKQQ